MKKLNVLIATALLATAFSASADFVMSAKCDNGSRVMFSQINEENSATVIDKKKVKTEYPVTAGTDRFLSSRDEIVTYQNARLPDNKTQISIMFSTADLKAKSIILAGPYDPFDENGKIPSTTCSVLEFQ